MSKTSPQKTATKSAKKSQTSSRKKSSSITSQASKTSTRKIAQPNSKNTKKSAAKKNLSVKTPAKTTSRPSKAPNNKQTNTVTATKTASPTTSPTYPKKPLPKTVINFNKQMEYTFDAWVVKKPTIKFRLYRTGIFLLALTLTIFWPMQNYLAINYALIVAAWIVIVNISKPVPRFFILLNIMLTTTVIYYTMKIFIP